MGFFDLFRKKKTKELPRFMPGQLTVRQIFENIKDRKAYFAGGTLCVDNVDGGGGDVLMFNLDGDYFWSSGNGRSHLSRDNRRKLFEIYKEHKGETDYYKEQLEATGWKD